jgi:soluble cytochrome b562
MQIRHISQFLVIAGLVTALSGAKADSPLAVSMKHMAKAYKELATDLQSPQENNKSAYLELVGTMKTEATNSEGYVPAKVEGMPADQQPAMVAAYKKSMGDLITSIDQLSSEVQAGNWDAARKSMETLRQEMLAGHKQFIKHKGQ